ncbi:MAG: amidohydrolase family protein, partial [Pyrinomonadaceae bacterium]
MKTIRLILALALSSVPSLFPIATGAGAAHEEKEFELVIAGGRVVDGTGNPWFLADVAVRGGRIVEIGRVAPERAARMIDARGRVVTPGFIDVHGHVEENLDSTPTADNFLQMGVTSTVTGNCGFSKTDLGEWFAKLERLGVSMNVASLVGHNVVRRAGMDGDFNRPPTPEELQ